MCLAVPGKIIEIYDSGGMRMCKIDFGGVIREACLQALPDAKVGEFTIIHAGFALNTLSEEEAQETLEALRELGEIENELDAGAVL
ncbi:HypC/HybG/HupF family hydrogenase formation chaperone [Leptolinea tardivitalis]|uniref:Hydrogenase assembly protein HypC n=1 Tax=Leptolinea tardivitalis TaxID=229920 RepID=A0A0P6X1D4_9CHLR|nr:HypC/HybG/HupF family hydrogenase formation chaperone [Leptolinea tardivitalis]KPL74720.1 hydrogenase assembly protein HypC [Leptolinea tardivitalis]GAP22914.1 hydrogenase maturation protein HypC [Leptolinea tardivitalis]